jgi:hypothetical protein
MAPLKTWTVQHIAAEGMRCTISDAEAMDRLQSVTERGVTWLSRDVFVIGSWSFTPDFEVGDDELVRALGWLWKVAA